MFAIVIKLVKTTHYNSKKNYARPSQSAQLSNTRTASKQTTKLEKINTQIFAMFEARYFATKPENKRPDTKILFQNKHSYPNTK